MTTLTDVTVTAAGPAASARAPGGVDPTALRESLAWPLLFLTVAAAGGLRVALDGTLVFLPPPLFALVLATLLFAVCVRSGLIAAHHLVHDRRSVLQNTNGTILLATLWIAGAQVFNALTPERGLLNLVFNTFFLVLLWNTAATGADARRTLRGLQVVFGAAFVAAHVVLPSLFDPAGGLATRVVTTLLEGVTLGTLDHAAYAPATGYIAFATTALFVIGLVLLPKATPERPVGRTDAAPMRGSRTKVRRQSSGPL